MLCVYILSAFICVYDNSKSNLRVFLEIVYVVKALPKEGMLQFRERSGLHFGRDPDFTLDAEIPRRSHLVKV